MRRLGTVLERLGTVLGCSEPSPPVPPPTRSTRIEKDECMNEQMQMIEKLRKKVLWRYIVMIVLPFAAGISAILMLRRGMLTSGVPLVVVGSMVVLFIILLVISTKAKKEYRAYYKANYIDAMIKEVIPNGQYLPDQGFPGTMIANTGLIYMGNIYHSEDLITGVYNNVEFRRADVLIQEETRDSDGDTTTTTYFKGRWMIFESNKYFEADLQVIQKGFGYAQKRTGIFTRKTARRHAIETEDVTFNKEFKCLCQNDQEAFYLMTPVLMQGLMRLAAESDGKIMVGFVNNLIHVAIKSNKNSLEPPVFHRISDNDIREIQREIHAVTSFVEGMRIDNKIFMQTKY